MKFSAIAMGNALYKNQMLFNPDNFLPENMSRAVKVL